MGSVLFLASWAVLMGPLAYSKGDAGTHSNAGPNTFSNSSRSSAFGFGSTVTVYGGLLWRYCSNPLLFHRGESPHFYYEFPARPQAGPRCAPPHPPFPLLLIFQASKTILSSRIAFHFRL